MAGVSECARANYILIFSPIWDFGYPEKKEPQHSINSREDLRNVATEPTFIFRLSGKCALDGVTPFILGGRGGRQLWNTFIGRGVDYLASTPAAPGRS